MAYIQKFRNKDLCARYKGYQIQILDTVKRKERRQPVLLRVLFTPTLLLLLLLQLRLRLRLDNFQA